MKVKNEVYDTIKLVALLVAPISAFIAALADIWGIPYGSQIVATLTALDALLGAVVVVLKINYNKEKGGNES